jgi:hypothetical protein
MKVGDKVKFKKSEQISLTYGFEKYSDIYMFIKDTFTIKTLLAYDVVVFDHPYELGDTIVRGEFRTSIDNLILCAKSGPCSCNWKHCRQASAI